MEYIATLGCVIFITLLSLCEGNDILSVMTHKVEFRTEPPAETLSDTPKDCYEYLYGRLSEIRRHGTTWTNGVSDCSNCTCDNGDIRCFFHFCNGPSTGYMTPPSAESDDNSSALTLVESEDPDTYEASGIGPHDLVDDEDDVIFITDPKEEDYLSNHIVSSEKIDEKSRKIKLTKSRIHDMSDDEDLQEDEISAKWPAKVLPEKWQNELSTFETSSAPSAIIKSDNDLSLPREKDKKDRSENETHDVFKSYFCGKPCKKNCPQGYKVDPLSGCWKCKCNRCPSLLSCINKCPMGYSVDVHGCEICTCLFSELSNKDIVFKEDDDMAFSGPRDNLFFIPGDSVTPPRVENDFKWPNTILEDNERSVTPVSTHLITADPSDDDEVYTTTQDEPCNTTEPRGCLDGSRKFHVGGRWSRGPCVSCKCVAPGYSECNITQCHPLYSCPHAHRYTPPGACCTLCKAFSALNPNDRAHESRSTSRIQTEMLPPSVPDEEDFAMDESWPETPQKPEDDATVKSLAKDDQSLLLLILIPMGVIFSLGIFLSTTMWRRYHRDKYDINSYRPDERQKLRPVKTLLDEHSSLKHV